jgi:DNA-binding NtrC family response regulator
MPLDADGTTRSFRLAEVEASLDASDGLEKFWIVAPRGKLRVPGYDGELGAAEFHLAAKSLLEGAGDYRFVPVLEDERRGLLGLAYRRHDGSVGMMVSGGEPGEFVQKLAAFAQASQRAPSTLPSRPHTAVPREVVGRFGAVETRSTAFAKVLDELSRVASSDIGILFLGESGTGKEHLARAVHQASPRANRPFVAVNCSALSAELIESELFGHKRGAFTGAHGDRDGAFVGADGGTLLLDEIGDAPPRVQVALLRALETRRVKPVGSDGERSVDVRVLAATSRDVRAMMDSGEFREDLYYRLAEASVSLPPLRHRPEDIPSLAAHLLSSLAPAVRLSSQAELALIQNPWPGNVRELKNALKRAVALAHGTTLLQAIHLAPLSDSSSLTDPPSSSTDLAIVFPPHVIAHADLLWSGERSTLEDVTKYELRALQRAALLYLRERTPLEAWPKGALQLWQRLFGAKWATSEDGRGLRELVRELGLDVRDESVREGVRRRATERA